MIHLNWSAPSLWHGLRAYAREAGWLLVAPPRPSGPPKNPRAFDGVIVLIGEDTLFDVRKSFPGAKIVDIRGVEGLKPDGLVMVDHERVGRMAAEYLHGLGCRSFLGLDLKKYWRGLRERVTAYGRRLAELGVARESSRVLHYDDWGKYEAGDVGTLRTRLKRALAGMALPVGVFSADGYAADVFEQGVMELGYRVPEDIAVLSTDNDRSICEMARVPLSSVDVNLSKLGYEAARLLDRLMAGDKNAPREIVIPPLGIEKRRSTERTSCDDPIVTAIMEYIREHFMEKITAELIIHDIHASRTNAFVRFRKVMGRSIGEEIERVRIEHAQSLLTTTDYKVDAVARLSGYLNTSAFCRAFKACTGRTPSEVRSRR
ncbi:helix-turn-helix domain-containing protein [Opitutaceae bacterium TAV4]|nr:helix-turn-helix domain-containing protein [Opitutaceae bacterium TAV4]RRJ99833.1 helix-turn-helix domain-containing protein [Opitutaceae bacterium TAV3]